ncbi:MAG TPA: zinc ABC transporter permease, partial [Cytophagales bacterium]|nr:zinc ABC transporter permease [Cytophagales bacterium]
VGIQAVGVVLMAAMLITPAAAARFWTDRLSIMLILATTFGVISGVTGSFISYTATAMPTGPWVVVIISIIAGISFFFAPRKGIFFRVRRQMNNRRMILDENILKTFFNLGENDHSFKEARSWDQLLVERHFVPRRLRNGLARLRRQGFLERQSAGWVLTQAGFEKGKRTVRLHRLWELYLTQYLRIAPDHVHEDAETIEHVITPELEQKLQEKLGFPEVDPHQSEIPYR